MTARVSMLLKSRASLKRFRAYFLPGRAKDLSAPWYLNGCEILNLFCRTSINFTSSSGNKVNENACNFEVFTVNIV